MNIDEICIESHDRMDKSFQMSNTHISFQVDYDDVDHEEVDATIIILKRIIDKYWSEEEFEKEYRLAKIKRWDENKYNFQSDYESLSEYLND